MRDRTGRCIVDAVRDLVELHRHLRSETISDDTVRLEWNSVGRPASCPVAHGVDLLDPGTLTDPYRALAPLRDAGGVAYLADLDHYVVLRYADIERILFDRDSWSASNASSPLIPLCARAQAVLDEGYHRIPTLNNADPPRHGPMRRAVFRCMTPPRLAGLEPSLRAYARRLVLALADEPVVDLIEALAFPFPGSAAFSLLGFPAARHRPAQGVERHPGPADLRAPLRRRTGHRRP